LTKIYDVYRTTDGRIYGEDERITQALEHADSIMRNPDDGK
jgi:hypothetical protein